MSKLRYAFKSRYGLKSLKSMEFEEVGAMANELIGGFAEIKEGGEIIVGPIDSIEVTSISFSMCLKWIADNIDNKWTKIRDDVTIGSVKNVAHFYLMEDRSIDFNFSQCGVSGTIYPLALGKNINPD